MTRPQPRTTTGAVPLTDRELSVVRYAADGLTNRKIGEMLLLTEDTIKTHMKRLLRKLGANDRAHAVAICIRNRWIA
jgi:two-component system nitrate/nitrite response regulator NarL